MVEGAQPRSPRKSRGLEGPAGLPTIRRLPLVVSLALVAIGCLMGLACGPQSPLSDATSPRPTSASRATVTPEPTPTALAAATPKPAAGLRTVELDARYRPVYVDGLEYAAIGPHGQLYIVNVETGQRTQVTNDEHPKYAAALSASHVAWADHRRKIELNDLDTDPPFNYSADIFVLDRATGEEKRITEAPARRGGLEISGDWLVWMDRRNESGQDYVNFDIYAYNLRTGEEMPVAVAPGSQRSPAIHGDTVVWADNRNSPVAGTSGAGCSNCPENRFDIYALDLTTGDERVLVQGGYFNLAPDINGTHLAWQAHGPGPGRPAEVRLLDLESGLVRAMGQGRNFFSGPSLSDRHVVWSTSWPCDVMPVPDTVLTGAYVGHLETGEVWQLTDYVEPVVFLSGNMAVVIEYCWGGGPTYAVFLD